MPQITRITPQKNQGRYNIYIDNQFAFGINETIFLEKGLRVGQEISKKELDEIITKDKISKFLDLANAFLSVRPRSEGELKEYLAKKISKTEQVKYYEASHSPIIGKVLAVLKKYGYIDDKSFAKWFTLSRLKSRPKSIRLIKFELKRKGVAPQILESLNFSPTQDKNSAIKSVQKKIDRWRKLPPLEYKKKFFSYLITRGFNYETINEAFAFFEEKR